MEAAPFSGRIAPRRIYALGIKERMARGTQQVDARAKSAAFLDIAEGLGLGVAASGFHLFGRLTIPAHKRYPRPTLKEGDRL